MNGPIYLLLLAIIFWYSEKKTKGQIGRGMFEEVSPWVWILGFIALVGGAFALYAVFSDDDKWKCDSSKNTCTKDPSGAYTSQSACDTACTDSDTCQCSNGVGASSECPTTGDKCVSCDKGYKLESATCKKCTSADIKNNKEECENEPETGKSGDTCLSYYRETVKNWPDVWSRQLSIERDSPTITQEILDALSWYAVYGGKCIVDLSHGMEIENDKMLKDCSGQCVTDSLLPFAQACSQEIKNIYKGAEDREKRILFGNIERKCGSNV